VVLNRSLAKGSVAQENGEFNGWPRRRDLVWGPGKCRNRIRRLRIPDGFFSKRVEAAMRLPQR
jgi:hypothetical protein